MGDSFSTMKVVQYMKGIASVTVGVHQYYGGHSYCGGNLQYCGRITAVHVGIVSVLWRVFSTVGEEF